MYMLYIILIPWNFNNNKNNDKKGIECNNATRRRTTSYRNNWDDPILGHMLLHHHFSHLIYL